MKHLFFLILYILFNNTILYSQSYTKLAHASIHKVELKDSFVIRAIDSFILIHQKSDTDLIKYGYIVIKLDTNNFIKLDSIFRPCFKINYSYALIKDINNDKLFPNYYTFQNNKLILIYKNETNHFRQNSKRILLKHIKKFVTHPLKEYARTSEGKKFIFYNTGNIVHSPWMQVCSN